MSTSYIDAPADRQESSDPQNGDNDTTSSSAVYHPLFDINSGTTTSDVELRSQDGVLFGVHRLILGEASEFFKTMYSLPGDPNPQGSSPLPIDTESSVIALALSIIYGKAYSPQLVRISKP
ncbi:hypothetical protein DL93DRAFT_2089839 [Clavulina sp. PMI_390]|nr:hypothetical protein DL93DRAFT_2089839 [Clavulina sp. PMI_390]